MYVHQDSLSCLFFKESFKSSKRFNLSADIYNHVLGPIHGLGNFFKAIEGKMFKEGEWSQDSYYFYDENEWRYTPAIKLTEAANLGHPLRVFLSKEQFLDERVREQNNQLMSKHCSLQFEVTDIKYIFVKYESEIDSIVDFIIDKFNVGSSEISKNYFYGKIISIEKLIEDL
jgi:hypothetical protein